MAVFKVQLSKKEIKCYISDICFFTMKWKFVPPFHLSYSMPDVDFYAAHAFSGLRSVYRRTAVVGGLSWLLSQGTLPTD